MHCSGAVRGWTTIRYGGRWRSGPDIASPSITRHLHLAERPCPGDTPTLRQCTAKCASRAGPRDAAGSDGRLLRDRPWSVYGLVAHPCALVSPQHPTPASAHSTSSFSLARYGSPATLSVDVIAHRRPRHRNRALVRRGSDKHSDTVCTLRPASMSTKKHLETNNDVISVDVLHISTTASSVVTNYIPSASQEPDRYSPYQLPRLASYSGPASSSTTGQWSEAPYISLRISHIFTRSSSRSLTTTTAQEGETRQRCTDTPFPICDTTSLRDPTPASSSAGSQREARGPSCSA